MTTNHVTAEETASVNEVERLYQAGFHKYLRVAEAIAGDRESGLDGVQEGFARALRYRSDFRGEASVSTWIWTCVINAAKAARPRRGMLLPKEVVGAGTQDSGPAPTVRDLIASLPERQRLVLFLRYYVDLDYQTIADALGIQLGTVGATLKKAQSTLRRQLEEAHDDQS